MSAGSVKVEELRMALARLKPVFSGASTLPILSMVLVEPEAGGFRLAATNLDTHMSVSIAGDVGDLKPLAVPGARLLKAVANIPGEELRLSLEKRTLTLSTDHWRLKLFTLLAEEFPPAPALPDSAEEFEVQGDTFALALGAALRSVSDDGTRFVLNGVLFCHAEKRLQLVATDGRRLFVTKLPADAPEGLQAIVPKLAVERLIAMSAGEEVVSLRFGDNLLEATAGEWTLRTKLIEGNYPNYDQCIPERGAKHRIVAPRAELLAALPFVEITAGAEPTMVLMVKDGSLTVQSSMPDVGEAEVTMPVREEGGYLKTAFNPGFFGAVLKSFQGETVSIEIADEASPALLEEAESLAVLMPKRIS
jgi:DNA polymerase-3 subunit beta